MNILTKESSQELVRNYFNGVLELKKRNEEFPVDIDEVWQLVYSERGKAVRALKSNFIEGEDYKISFAQNGNRKIGSSHKQEYHLSLPCLEYFIVRKVRPVFEVYRQVFHKVAEREPLSQAQMLLQSAQLLVDIENRQKETEQRTLAIEQKLERMEEERKDATEQLLQSPLSEETVPEMSIRDVIRKLVNVYSSATGIKQSDVWHSVYNSLYYTYHISINNYQKVGKESKPDIAERKGFLPKIHAIISTMVYGLQKNK